MIKNIISSIICLTLLTVSLASAQTTTPDFRCGQDLNGDGILDSDGETASCTALGGEQLCPISSADCIITTTNPVCPDIAPLNPSTGKCEMPPQCASGAYDSSMFQCVLTTEPSCANTLAAFNSGRNFCESLPRCAAGAIYDPVGDTCVSITAHTCPLNTALNAVSDKCEASPSCLTGTFNTSTNQCEIHTTSASICPAGTAMNPVSDRCEAALSCLFGTYNTVQNMCMDSMAAVCPSGTIFSAGSGKCEAPPTCSSGTYNPILKLCTTPNTVAPTCPSGYTFSSISNKCERSPNCAAGTLYNNVTLQCEAAPTCVVGSYDPVANQCLQNSTSAPQCPATTSFVGGAVDKCQASYTCPSGTTINGSVCTGAALCPPGGTLNTATDQCSVPYTSTSIATCAGGGTLNGTTDLCQLDITCAAGYAPWVLGGLCVRYATASCPAPPPTWPTPSLNTSTDTCVSIKSPYTGFSVSESNCRGSCLAYGYPTYIYRAGGGLGGASACTCSGAAPVCASGYSYDPVNNTCIRLIASTCSTGVLNFIGNYCESPPSCSSGAYDATLNLCVTYGTTYTAPSCPVGTTYSVANDRCESNPACPAATTYSVSSGQCEAAPSCSSGSFVANLDACQTVSSSAASCPSGSVLNNALDICQGNPTCQSGSIWNGTSGMCEQTPICPPGGTFNAGTHLCDISITTTPTCVSPTVFYSGTGKCESTPTCSNPSYAYDISQKECVYKVSPQCPAGTTLNIGSDVCDSSPTCQSSSYIYHPELDLCSWDEVFPAQCPPGTLISALSNKCDATPTCNIGVYDNSANNCLSYSASFCGSSVEAINTTTDLCESHPLCSSGTFDQLLHQCVTLSAVTCPVGGIFNRTRHVCEASPGCLTGSYDLSTGMCANIGGLKTPSTCDVGTLNTTSDKCDSSPICSSGSYDALTDNCVAHSYTAASCSNLGGFPTTYNAASGNCYFLGTSAQCSAAGGTYQLEQNVGFACTKPLCGSPKYGGYNPSTGALSCISDSVVSATCDGASVLNIFSDMCEIDPTCAPDAGLYDPAENMCVSFKWSCPHDNASSTYQCLDNAGVQQCSPNACVDIVTNPPTDYTTDPDQLVDDGSIDPSTGQCIGQLVIFNGNPAQCKPPGVGTNGFDCCSSGSASDFVNCMGSLGIGGVYGVHNCGMFGDPVDFMTRCGQKGVIAVAGVNARRAHLVGHYCTTRWPIIGCVQRAKVYCVFTSKLGRIIQEQGRPQLIAFGADGGWGPPESPNCRGFSPEEFSMLDFSKIDLSEFISDIQTNMIPNIQQQMQDNVNNFYNNTQ